MTINSNGSTKFFPSNRPYHFRSQLNTPLCLDGCWKMALVDISYRGDIHPLNSILYIFSNICSGSIIDGVHTNLLRKLDIVKGVQQAYQYVDVNKSEMIDIEFFIRDEHQENATFLIQPIIITVHFKKYPFLL